ncbi:MAG: hypothetical protein V1787_02305 [Candidatus Micrarchaeota archaeon]
MLAGFKFIALFLALFLPAFFLLQPVRELNLFAAWSGQQLLGLLFGIPSLLAVSGGFPVLDLGGFSAEFVDLCSAKLELAVLFGIVFASFEKPLAYRLKGFLAGAAFLFAFNALRIALTLRAFSSSDLLWSALLHDVLFRASLVVGIVTFYALWYYYALPRSKAGRRVRHRRP